MSILDSLKGAINNRHEYRTSVLMDFSCVKKAYFHVYQRNNPYTGTRHAADAPYSFDYIESFPVQINPNSLTLDYGNDKKMTREQPLASVGKDSVPVVEPYRGYSPGSLRITLEYNIYDEYNARTMNGGIPQNSISLYTGNPTSLDQVRLIAGNIQRKYVLFKWGPIHYFGALESVNITYNVFSPWGEPLAASAIVEIAHQPLAFGKDGVEIDPEDCKDHLKATPTQRFELHQHEVRENSSVAIGLSATNALR